MKGRLAGRARGGQALVEFALVFPLFLLLLFAIIVFGLYVFYSQQLENGAREAARYAAIHSSTAQCPTVSRINPVLTNRNPNTYARCDAPEGGWPRMTGAARSNIWGMAPNQIALTACWSGLNDQQVPPNADALPADPTAVFVDCTIGGVNPRTSPQTLPCPATTSSSGYSMDSAKADGDDKASDISVAPGNNTAYPTTVTVYTCFQWTPPMAGFVLIPNQITLRAVVTEALQRQQ
jgi:Flp pilus assembly protein TadG